MGKEHIQLCVVVLVVLCGFPSCRADLARGFIFERNEYAYKIVLEHDDRRTFYEAEEICQEEEDGHLVSITSGDENVWLNDKIRQVSQTGGMETFWVGANDKQEYGHYKWVDGSNFAYSKALFRAGRPYDLAHPQEYERCVTLKSTPSMAGWVDEDCYEVFGYICKTEGLPRRLVEHKRWGYEFDYGDYIYKFVLMPYEMLTWPEAEMYCEAVETGHLLSIKNPTESLRIRQRLGQLRRIFGFTRLWIGASDISSEGQFAWTDRTPMRLTNWARGEPSGRSRGEEHDCVAMGMSPNAGQWHDEYCLQHLPFICKIRMCNVRADLGFIIDGSGSVLDEGFRKAKRFVKAIAAKFQVSQRRAHVGVIRYSTRANIMFNFNEYYSPDSLSYAIDDIEYTEGGTRTELALRLARNKLYTKEGGARPLVPKILILMTDGRSENPRLVAKEARKLKMAGVYVIAVGIGKGVRREELLSIASSPRDVINVKSFRTLVKRVADVRDKVCDGVNPLTGARL